MIHPLLDLVALERTEAKTDGAVMPSSGTDSREATVIFIGSESFPLEGVLVKKDFEVGDKVLYRADAEERPERPIIAKTIDGKEILFVSVNDIVCKV